LKCSKRRNLDLDDESRVLSPGLFEARKQRSADAAGDFVRFAGFVTFVVLFVCSFFVILLLV
jgi:hypothetical protein